MSKNIVKALVTKKFSEAKDLVFQSLYAKVALAMDDARMGVASSVFNSVEELPEMAQTPARAREMAKKIKDAEAEAQHFRPYDTVDDLEQAKGRLEGEDAAEKRLPVLVGKGGKVVRQLPTTKKTVGKGGKVIKHLPEMAQTSARAERDRVSTSAEQVDESGKAKLRRMRRSQGRAWARGDAEKMTSMGTAIRDKTKKEDKKDINRTGSVQNMTNKRADSNRKRLGIGEGTYAVPEHGYERRRDPIPRIAVKTGVPAGASKEEMEASRKANPYKVKLDKGRPAGAK